MNYTTFVDELICESGITMKNQSGFWGETTIFLMTSGCLSV